MVLLVLLWRGNEGVKNYFRNLESRINLISFPGLLIFSEGITSRHQAFHKIWHLLRIWCCCCRCHSNRFPSLCSDFLAFWKGGISFLLPFFSPPFGFKILFQAVRDLTKMNVGLTNRLVTTEFTISNAATHPKSSGISIKRTFFQNWHPNHLPCQKMKTSKKGPVCS